MPRFGEYMQPSDVGSLAPVLAKGTQSFSAVNATFKTGPTWSGNMAWVNATMTATPHSTLSLTAGTSYWLVISVTNNGHAVLNREVNPRAALVYYSSQRLSDELGSPPDGPYGHQLQDSHDCRYHQPTRRRTGSTLAWMGRAIIWFADGVPTQGVVDLCFHFRHVRSERVHQGGFRILTPRDDQSSCERDYSNERDLKVPKLCELRQAVNITAGIKYWIVIQGICFLGNLGIRLQQHGVFVRYSLQERRRGRRLRRGSASL